MKSVRYSQPSKSARILLAVFTLLLLTVSSGVLFPSSSLQTSIAAFAQTSSSSPSLADEIIDETSTSLQDSTSDDNVLEDNNEFGDEGAAIGQDNTEHQDTASVGVQDEDATQEQDQTQDAVNTNVDSDLQVGEQLIQQPPTEPPTPEEDTTPPTLTVPDDITVDATSADGAVVTFVVTAQDNVDGTATLDEENTLIQDNVDGSITIACEPPSGTPFPIGETVVQCTAMDEAGNTATASFTVNPIITCQGVPATIVGTPGNDDLSGTGARDVIALLEGDDRVNAGEGDDLICGDEGNDPLLVGDAGDDEVFGGEGNDFGMFGGSDNDRMDGGAGDDRMDGGAGDDNLDSIDGVVNNDSLNGDTGTDTCRSDPDPTLNCNP